MTRKVAYWILLLGTVSSAIVFLVATWDTHRQVAVLSNADKLSDAVKQELTFTPPPPPAHAAPAKK